MIEWREIKNYNGKYLISNTGMVKNGYTNHILKQTITKSGYYTVVVKPDGRLGGNKCFRVHREVAEAFIPNPENKPCVNHLNGNKLSNDLSNLEWCTYSENSIHAHATGLHIVKKGFNNPLSVLDQDFIEYIKNIHIPYDKQYSIRALSREYAVDYSTLRRSMKY